LLPCAVHTELVTPCGYAECSTDDRVQGYSKRSHTPSTARNGRAALQHQVQYSPTLCVGIAKSDADRQVLSVLITSLGPPTLPPRRSPSEWIRPHSRVFEMLPASLERTAKCSPTSNVVRHPPTVLDSDSLRESAPRLNNAPFRCNLGTYTVQLTYPGRPAYSLIAIAKSDTGCT
jgi:hypothetical protein